MNRVVVQSQTTAATTHLVPLPDLIGKLHSVSHLQRERERVTSRPSGASSSTERLRLMSLVTEIGVIFPSVLRVYTGLMIRMPSTLRLAKGGKERIRLEDSAQRVLSDAELPWYRRWWSVALFGVATAALATTVVLSVPRKASRDLTLTLQP